MKVYIQIKFTTRTDGGKSTEGQSELGGKVIHTFPDEHSHLFFLIDPKQLSIVGHLVP